MVLDWIGKKIVSVKLKSEYSILQVENCRIIKFRPGSDASVLGTNSRQTAYGAEYMAVEGYAVGVDVRNLFNEDFTNQNIPVEIEIVLVEIEIVLGDEKDSSETWNGEANCKYTHFPPADDQRLFRLIITRNGDLTKKAGR